ncbi:hypothetical protein [Streptomyces zhihengii]|uniref:hypothetical protein n=1 Tax=Streptomyces zhihengii TaxID=1818004 RepID=UPI0033BD31F4
MVVEVAEALHWFSDQWIFWGYWPEVFALAVSSARVLGDPVWVATHLNYQAWALIVCEHRPAEGFNLALQAREAAENAGDLTQQAWAHYYLAWALQVQDDHDTAIVHNQRAAHLFAAAGDLHGTLQTMCGHAIHLKSVGHTGAAVRQIRDALDFLDRHADAVEDHIARFARRSLHVVAGDVYVGLGDWQEAVEHLETAVALSRDSGNIAMEGSALIQLGRALLSAGSTTEAGAAYARCLHLGSDVDPRVAAEARDRLADLDRLPPTVSGRRSH